MSLLEGVYFARKTNGTGSSLSTIQLGTLPGFGAASHAIPEYRKTQVGGLIRWEIDCIVIPVEPMTNDLESMRDEVNEYIAGFLNLNDFKPLDVKSFSNGRSFVRALGQQRGDLITLNQASTSRTLEADVALSDVRILDGEMMPHGGMTVRFIFVKETPIAMPSQRWCSFRIRAGGTGTESAQVNLTNDGVQSSRTTSIFQQTDGGLERLTVRTSYVSEFGTRTFQAIQDFASTKKVECLHSTPLLRTTRAGRFQALNTKDNYGDITLDASYGGSADDTIFANATLEDIRVLQNDEDGGVELEYTFVRVRPEFQSTSTYFRFRILSNGTGGHRKTVPLTLNDPESAWLGELDYFGTGKQTHCKIRVWMPNDHGATTLLNVQAKAEGIRNDAEFKPPLIKDLPRGKAIMPNISNNFGDVVQHTAYISSSDASGTVILDNCTMIEPPRIVDNLNEDGCMMEFTFGRIADSNEITG